MNPTLVSNYTETISLWFTNFEFNASIYYIVREIGFYIKGYNIIQTIGKITPIITILLIFYFAIIKENSSIDKIVKHALILLTVYFFISTTIHPWYLTNLVFLSVFTRYKFALIWSFVVIVSYYAYSFTPFNENLYLILVEYLIVFGVFFFEVFYPKKQLRKC
jgi:hypothetical protein